MKILNPVYPIIATALFLCSCSDPNTPNPKQVKPLRAAHVNPYKSGTYAHFRSKKGYPRNYGIWKNKEVLARTTPSNSSVLIDLSAQRAYLMNGNDLAMDYPVATGTAKYPTPKGSYRVLEKLKEDKRSNTYGRIYDVDGKLVKADADARVDPVPEGGKYVGAPMPYWMRLTWDGVGMHKGNVPRRPASHGCIRTYYKVVSTVFDKVKVGTPVMIVE